MWRAEFSHVSNIICLISKQIFADNAIRREMSTLPTVCCQPGCSWTGIFKDFVVSSSRTRFRQGRTLQIIS